MNRRSLGMDSTRRCLSERENKDSIHTFIDSERAVVNFEITALSNFWNVGEFLVFLVLHLYCYVK